MDEARKFVNKTQKAAINETKIAMIKTIKEAIQAFIELGLDREEVKAMCIGSLKRADGYDPCMYDYYELQIERVLNEFKFDK